MSLLDTEKRLDQTPLKSDLHLEQELHLTEKDLFRNFINTILNPEKTINSKEYFSNLSVNDFISDLKTFNSIHFSPKSLNQKLNNWLSLSKIIDWFLLYKIWINKNRLSDYKLITLKFFREIILYDNELLSNLDWKELVNKFNQV